MYNGLTGEQIESSIQRDYSFDTVSGEKVDTLYYPEGNDEFIEKLNFINDNKPNNVTIIAGTQTQ